MKKPLLILFAIVFAIAAFGCSNDSIEKLQALGTNEFSIDRWANASQEARGKMIYSFLKKHDINGMVPADITKLLGPSTAYYNYDEFPAYVVGPKDVKSEYGNGYLFAFPVDRKSGEIKDFVIFPKIK